MVEVVVAHEMHLVGPPTPTSAYCRDRRPSTVAVWPVAMKVRLQIKWANAVIVIIYRVYVLEFMLIKFQCNSFMI